MQFVAYPPDATYEKFMGDHAWRIFATGDIDADAGKRLTALIANKGVPQGSQLYLHSPGGSLVGGMDLGRVIRKNELRTIVGQYDPKQKYIGSKPGYCYSACATAFLGGKFRYWTDGSVFGVHRFFWKGRSDNDADIAQIVSAAVVEYIRSMDVDTKLFAIASQAGASELITPTHQTLLELNVVNDGRTPARWTIESIPQGVIYLKGEQDTDRGINKFILACPARGAMFLYGIFAGGQNTEQALKFPINLLFLDGRTVQMDNRLESKQAMNNNINLMYRLDASLLDEIIKAKTVGVGLRPSATAPIFSGFADMPFSDGAGKLPGFLAVCRQGTSGR
jgi:hypothetical protein